MAQISLNQVFPWAYLYFSFRLTVQVSCWKEMWMYKFFIKSITRSVIGFPPSPEVTINASPKSVGDALFDMKLSQWVI